MFINSASKTNDYGVVNGHNKYRNTVQFRPVLNTKIGLT